VITIDTDVLGIYHVFTQDERYSIAATFMNESRKVERGVTIFNLYELCGILATMGRRDEARILFNEYLKASDVEILYPRVKCTTLVEYWGEQNQELLMRIEKGMRLGDAAILWVIESNACEVFITWNISHYMGKTNIKVQTPKEWLLERGYWRNWMSLQ
jgi:hypothetical protein